MSINAKEGMYYEERKVLKEKSKIGHRRINDEGTVTYKKKTTSEIQKALQLGIKITVTLAHNKSKRDMLLKDFGVVETLPFPRTGGKDTPSHDLSDFTFKTFAPIAFRYFRDFFQVDITDYLDSICHQELRELSNAGASGSIFYITCDDEFIIKTVQHKEASFLQKLLPEYYINLIQHPRTLLPKFYGLYCYQTMGKNIRFVIMNNLVPSIRIHEKYDLKGSTYKRSANETEKTKPSPTLKDLDFRKNHDESLYLEVDTYEALMNTIQRDCRVLESFSIMDYSLLLGIHNLDQNLRMRKENEQEQKNHALSSPNHAVKDMSVFEDENSKTKNDSPDISQLIIQKDSFLSDENNRNSIKDIESELLLNIKSSENSESTSGDYYCTPGIADIDNKEVKFVDGENEPLVFNKSAIGGLSKLVKNYKKISPEVSSRKDEFIRKLYPIGKQLHSYISVNPKCIIKSVENCVERVFQSVWLDCDKDLYSVVPPVAILSSGSSDASSVIGSEEEISSIDTDVIYNSLIKNSDPDNDENTIRGQNNQSNAIDGGSPAAVSPESSIGNQIIVKPRESFNRQKSRSKSTRRIAAFSTVLESIQAPVEQVELNPSDEEYIPTGGIPARNKGGDRLILFMGIIDILQSYRIMKKMEHNVKAIFLDPSAISVTNPTFYAQRFQDFFANIVFKKIPSLDQPQILGSHVRRFRNFVHMAMRQNPDRKRTSSVRKENLIPSDKERQNQSREVIDESELVKDEFENLGMPEYSPTDAANANKFALENSPTL